MNTIVLIDGQNLFYGAKRAWTPPHPALPSPYEWPSYDVEKLADALATKTPGRVLSEIRFYTGVPNRNGGTSQRFWHDFWSSKLRYLNNKGIYTYRGAINTGRQEKGVDVSLALDLIQATYEERYEVAIIVSQDTDFGPAVKLARQVGAGQNRKLYFESAFPLGPSTTYTRGIPGTTWVPIDQATYDACLDPRDYRPHRSP
ncbi:MAG: NYN domain-containing protein [Chloroflexi bacterium]|nr:NYN domain-containing protein [Chloroflexota bacterium]